MLFGSHITESEGIDMQGDVVCTNVEFSKQFVTSTFSKTETLIISLMFVMNVMVLPYVLSQSQISKL